MNIIQCLEKRAHDIKEGNNCMLYNVYVELKINKEDNYPYYPYFESNIRDDLVSHSKDYLKDKIDLRDLTVSTFNNKGYTSGLTIYVDDLKFSNGILSLYFEEEYLILYVKDTDLAARYFFDKEYIQEAEGYKFTLRDNAIIYTPAMWTCFDRDVKYREYGYTMSHERIGCDQKERVCSLFDAIRKKYEILFHELYLISKMDGLVKADMKISFDGKNK